MDHLQWQSATPALCQTAWCWRYCWRFDLYCSAHGQRCKPCVESSLCNRLRCWYCHTLCSLEGHVCCKLKLVAFNISFSNLLQVLHGMHHRHLRPWELFTNDDDNSSTYDLKSASFDSFGSSNSYEDEPWIAKYDKRNFVRKIFDREVWIQEPALRQIQDTIFLQAIITAVVISAIIVGVFCAIPKGNKF